MKLSRKYWLLPVFLYLAYVARAQEDCKDEINYSISNVTVNGAGQGYFTTDDQSLQITIGQPYVGPSGSYSQGISARSGFWGYYLLEPQGPRTKASEGEYLDRIEVEWDVVDDRKGPVVTEEITKIYRNGRLLTSVPLRQTSYVDYNVFPGEFYTYEIVTSNKLGDAWPMQAVGFLNPNGRVTGTVETRLGVPVADVKVVLTPNLGRSLEMDGEKDYAYFLDQSYEFGEYYTIEGWWRNVESKEQTLFVAVDSGTTNTLIKVSLDEEGRIHYFHDGDGADEIPAFELVSKNGYNLDAFSRKWHHFAAVYDTTMAYLYVDGNRVAETEVTGSIVKTAELEIGKDGPKQYSGYYSGYLDDFRIWSIGREREQIRKYKDITLTGEEEYLQAYWKFDEQFSDKIFDFAEKPVKEREHGYLCDVTRSEFISPAQLGAYTDAGGDYVIKGVYYGSGQTFSVQPSKETSIGFSLEFDGVDDFVSYQLDRIEYEDAFTLEGWFKTGVDGKDMVIFEATNSETQDVLVQLGLQSTGEFYASSGFGGSLSTITSTEMYNDEFWYHYALTHNGSSITLYIDGEEVGSAADGLAGSVTARTVIGRSDPIEYNAGASYYEGALDEIRLWDYTRTENQINATLNQVIPGDEKGTVDPEGELGLMAYWMFGEGQGSVISDATPNGHTGDLMNYQQIEVSPNEFIVANWDGDDIPLNVEFFVHDFDPNARNVSLDPSNVSVDRVDFADISQLGISGFVRYAGTNCFADSVEILVNGSPTLPQIFTDESGKFTVEFEPGATGQIISYKLEDHVFDPGFIELPRLVRPIAGLAISDVQTRNFTGRVVGGSCGFPIGEAQVVISTSPYCYSDTATVDEQGNFEFLDIPPLKYVVSVLHSNPTIQTYFNEQGAEEMSLAREDRTLDFIYRAPLNVVISGLEPDGCTATVLEQNKKKDIQIRVYEEYFGNECDVEAGLLTINDNISDRDQASFEFNSSVFEYTLKPGEPNILSGGANPYQKNIQIVAEDTLGRLSEQTLWVIVTGNRPRSVDFATTTPDIPFIILRAPPGDQSGAYLEQGTTLGTSMSMSAASSNSTSGEVQLLLGQSFKTEAGSPFFSVGTEIERELTLTTSFNVSETMISESETSFEFTSTDAFSTAGDGDIFVGGAMNLLYGVTDILKVDESCNVILSEDVIFAPDGFSTTFIYSKSFIEDSVIPELAAINDTASVKTWNSFLDLNNRLKAEAEFVENLSFDAGSAFERSVTTTQSKSEAVTFEMAIDESFAVAAGFAINGSGASGSVTTSVSMAFGSSKTVSRTVERTVGFTLADDDSGDNYTVNIKQDPVYATPVFETISSATSCPWEGGLKRQGVQLGVDKNIAINVPEDQPAIFNLSLGNISETREPGTYFLNVLSESNPDGAKISLNGVPLGGENSVPFFLEYGEQINATLTVEKGPSAYDYSGLKVMLYSPCEKEENDIPLEPFASIQSLDVSFIEVCSPITIFDPGDDWVITQASNNKRNVTLTDYVVDRTDFTEVKLQYRQKIEGQPWINAVEMPKADLEPGTTVVEWDVTSLDDGAYEIRALTFCDAVPDPRSSQVLSGTIDRTAPILLGTPAPMDAILSANDEISIEFNEDIQCGDILSLTIPVSLTQGEANNVALSNTETGLFIEGIVTCEGNKLIIVPDIQNKFLEEQVIRVDVLGMTDALGNQQREPVTWEFLVRRNPLEWLGGDIQSVAYEGQSSTFVRQIKNNGAFDLNVNLSGALDVQTLQETLLPSWIMATPRSFTLQPGGTQDVTFSINNQLSGGQYNDVVTAATSFGAPELRFDVRVLCAEPKWQVNASQFEHSITLTGQLDVRGELSTDEYDMVAAFVGDELRGVGKVIYAPELANIPDEHPYLVFMTIYTNTVQEEVIDFQVWDASRCQLYGQVAESYVVSASSQALGSPTNPKTITVTNKVIQDIPLSKGWNWISFNLATGSTAVNDRLRTLENSERGDIVKSQTTYSQYVPSMGWVGTLSNMDSTAAFRVKIKNADTLRVVGSPIDFERTTVVLNTGWNWVSFLPPVSMELNEALSGLTATSDFVIKSQTTFAQYVDFQGWIGSLDFLRPNQGYLIYTDRPQTLTYPVNNTNARIVAEERELQLPTGWKLDPAAYEHNSNYIIKVAGNTISEGDYIGLFDGEELIGAGVAEYVDFSGDYYFFVTAYQDGISENITVKYRQDEAEFTFENRLSFEPNQVFGTVEEPLIFRLPSNALGIASDQGLFDVYPNPADRLTTVKFQLKKAEKVHLVIQNLAGQEIEHRTLGSLSPGTHLVEVKRERKGQELPSGIYFIKLVIGEEVFTKKLIWR